MHDAITLGVPVLAIFFGILLNQRGLSELKADLKGDVATLKADFKSDMAVLKAELKGDVAGLQGSIRSLEAKIDRMQADLHQFNRELGRHDARLDALESQ